MAKKYAAVRKAALSRQGSSGSHGRGCMSDSQEKANPMPRTRRGAGGTTAGVTTGNDARTTAQKGQNRKRANTPEEEPGHWPKTHETWRT